MPSIALRRGPGLYPTHSGFVGVHEETPFSNLFIKYTHRPVTTFIPENIYLYSGTLAFMNLFGYRANLQLSSDYYNNSLKSADVYFNRFDGTKTPLVCVFKFNKGKDGKPVQDRIYSLSQHSYLINQNSSAVITILGTLRQDSESELLELLIKESDQHMNSVTYELDKTNPRNSEIDYNSEKILLSTKQTLSTDHKNEFYKYNHSYRYKRPKKSLLLYKNNAPMFDRQHFVQNIQAQDYDNVNVYYSTKLNTPLLIELINKRKKTHLQRINTDESKWTITHIAGYNEDRLVNYLRTVFRFVEEKQVKEQKKKQEEQQKREQQQQTGQETVQGPGSERGTQTTDGQRSQSTPTSSQPAGTSSRETVGPSAPSQGQASTSTAKICVFIDKQKPYLKSDVQKICTNDTPTKPESKVLDVQPETISVDSGDLNDSNYKIYTHQIQPNSGSLKKQTQDILIELTIYISTIDISLFNSGGDRREQLMYNSKLAENKLYVYFYESKNQPGQADKIPLMFHYNGQFYGPSKRDNYFTGWRMIDGIKGTSDTPGIKKQLDTINKELNIIQLSKIGRETCSYGFSKLGPIKITDFSTDRINVKVEQIGSTASPPPASPSPVGSCPTDFTCPNGQYLKYTHTTINKFQLGSIYYKDKEVKVLQERESATTPGNPISIGQTQNLVSVYYWINDTTRTYPLLIAIGKQAEGGGSTFNNNIDDYYKLISTDTGVSTSNYKWKQLGGQEKSDAKGPGTTKLVQLLDKINYSVKKVIKILIDKQQPYEVYLSNQMGKADGFTKDGHNKIGVQPFENGCTKLKAAGYVCYVHKVSEINSGVRFDYNTIGGLKFFISGTSGNDVEIPLQNDDGPLTEITYNKCMGDVYVYFYCKQGSDNPDKMPLMLRYNGGYYSPQDRDHYFKEWSYQRGLEVVTTPCGSENEGEESGDNYELLAGMLDVTNKELNRIYLTQPSNYGIPTNKPPGIKPGIDVIRVDVTKIPSKTPATRPYCKLVHRTMNSFDIGDIYYKTQDITKGGVQINGSGTGGSINVDRSTNHTKFVNPPGDNNPNTVVAYYHKDDSTHKLPQLIVLLQTDGPIDTGTDPITASRDTKYGYYVLATNGNGGGTNTFKYEWRTVDDVKPDPLTLDYPTEFSLLNSVIIMVEKQSLYNEAVISGAVKTLQNKSPGNSDGVNRLKDRNISVDDKTTDSGKCVSKYGYKLLGHDLTAIIAQIHGISPILGLRFLIPSDMAEGSYDEIRLYTDDKADQLFGPLYHTNTNNTVYVYFYDKDPRPLLLCLGTDGYIPKKNGEPTPEKQVNVDYTKWTRESKIKQCTCTGEGAESPNKEIIDVLTAVTGYLNPVQLHPEQIPDRASTTITATEPKIPTANATYELHKFTAIQTVQMKITREDVGCYDKYIYQPNGTNSDGTGFRLGNVIYISVNSNKPAGTVKYTGTANQHKYHVLKTVNVYYYDQDVGYSDPLLVVLHFGKISGESNDATEYWKLTKNDGTSGNGMEWDKDPSAKTQIGTGEQEKLITYLDRIRYSLKKVVMIKIDQNRPESYQLKVRPVNGSIGSGFVDIGSDNHIQVVECDDSFCTKLKANHYTCFQHKISDIEDSEQHQIGGLAMTLPGQGDQVVEIPLHNEGGSPLPQLTYNTCMGDVYVYFYCKKDGSTDNVPLMLRYNSKFYEPENRDNYFTKWEEESSLHSIVKGPCGDNGKHQALSLKLDTINKALNRIELTHDLGGKSNSKYGLPSSSPTSRNFNKNRVDVVKKPNNDESNRPYVKIAHRTINDFRIGDIYHGSDEIVTNGVKLNGTGDESTIKIDNNGDGKKNHRDFADTNNPNTVVAYYSITDKNFKFPQLILLVQTADSIDEDYKPITANSNSKYGYYILATCMGGKGHQYEWREPDDQGVSLDEKTELSLLNSVVILVEQKPITQGDSTLTYGNDKIKNAVQKAIELRSLTKSPGLPEDINRLKGKDVTLKDVTDEPPDSSLKDTGFRAIKHDLSTIVDPNIPGATGVTLIAILRFLIPDRDIKGEYKALTLLDSDVRDSPITLFHQKTQNSAYVYFYDPNKDGKGDPRPLLLCYNSKGYKARSMSTYDSQTWLKSSKIKECVCKSTDSELLKALVSVCNFLNPVFINRTVTGVYRIHRFNSQHISINLHSTPSNGKFCYNKYVHSAKPGFRLGRIEVEHSKQCIYEWTGSQDSEKCITSVLDESQNKYTPASEVVVYYYRGDKMYRNPLLVVLCKNGDCPSGTTSCTCKPYYVLQKDPANEFKKYKKETTPLDLDPSKNGQLEKILDRILFSISKSLQLDLSFRNTVKPKNVETPKKQCTTTCEGIYKARVYDNELGKPKKSSHTIDVNVCGPTQILDLNKQETGYQCYQHKLTTIQDISQINGLRLFLWDNRPDSDESECKITPPTTQEKKKCCELDLYEDTSCSTRKIDPIAYTTCKGDLYVYFYGSDPRPMLLCYNNESYAPQSMDEYNQKWCLVKQIPSCECDDKTGFKPEQLLQQLYQISMFLNPVRLWETLKAYEQVKAFIKEEKKKQKQSREQGKDVPKIGKLPEYIYKVQTFGDTDINIKVKSADLNCYRQYTFESAMGDSGSSVRRDYRLGDIYYGSNQGSQRGADSTCLKYPSNQRLQSVSLYYYMYDSEHRYPLIIQLDYGFGGELDDYYRVCNIGESVGAGPGGAGAGSNGGGPGGGAPGGGAPPPKPDEIASKITWVKMKEKGTDDANQGQTQASGSSGSASTSNGNCDKNCPEPTDFKGEKIDQDKLKELKLSDGEFVKQAHEVQNKLRGLNLAEAWFSQDYLELVAELQALIEARCFDVRKKYGIEYEKGDENKNLILVTDENCYEESIMGYLLGGGALGVAGGGGWKLATFVLTLFIKV